MLLCDVANAMLLFEIAVLTAQEHFKSIGSTHFYTICMTATYLNIL